MSKYANQRFTDVFNTLEREIPFDRAWSNGTGYFDHACSPDLAPSLKYGEMAKSQTPTGRRLIFIGTRLGPVVVFDRFDGQAGKEGDVVFVFNSTNLFNEGGWVEQGALGEGDMNLLLGSYGLEYSIGFRIEQVFQFMTKDYWSKQLNRHGKSLPA